MFSTDPIIICAHESKLPFGILDINDLCEAMDKADKLNASVIASSDKDGYNAPAVDAVIEKALSYQHPLGILNINELCDMMPDYRKDFDLDAFKAQVYVVNTRPKKSDPILSKANGSSADILVAEIKENQTKSNVKLNSSVHSTKLTFARQPNRHVLIRSTHLITKRFRSAFKVAF